MMKSSANLQPDGSLRTLKNSFTLPLNNQNANPVVPVVSNSSNNMHIRGLTPLAQLNSPDLRNLGLLTGTGITPYLNSPDFDKLISSSLAVGVTPTGPNGNAPQTPTTFLNPKFVSEEQEEFAQHFEEKLKRMIKKEQDENHHNVVMTDISYTNLTSSQSGNSGGMALPVVALGGSNTSSSYFPSAVAPIHATIVSSTGHIPTASIAPMTTTTSNQNYFYTDSSSQHHSASVASFDDAASDDQSQLSVDRMPVDFGNQEGMKLERKRQRNRDAARKCRERKLERIHFLEERVNELKVQNGKLQKTALELRDQLKTLQRVIQDHCKSGCRVENVLKLMV